MSKNYLHFSWAIIIILVALSAGCGGEKKLKTFRVEGTVEYKGSPVAGASVTFYPQDGGTDAFGKTDASGKYKLQTLAGEAEAGTTPGKYAVTISLKKEVPTGKKIEAGEYGELRVDEMTLKETLPQQYSTVQDTPFKDIVVEGKKLNTFDFKLE